MSPPQTKLFLALDPPSRTKQFTNIHNHFENNLWLETHFFKKISEMLICFKTMRAETSLRYEIKTGIFRKTLMASLGQLMALLG